MKQLKTKDILVKKREFDKLLEISIPKQLSNSVELDLLLKIRAGEKSYIKKLVDGSETMILELISRFGIPKEDYEIVLKITKTTLTKLAEKEVNNTTRECFLRFGAWCVRQDILKYLAKSKIPEGLDSGVG